MFCTNCYQGCQCENKCQCQLMLFAVFAQVRAITNTTMLKNKFGDRVKNENNYMLKIRPKIGMIWLSFIKRKI